MNPSQPPALSIKADESIGTHGADTYRVTDWDAFDMWARRNLPLYYRADSLARGYRMSDEDRLRLLVWQMTSEMVAVKDQLVHERGRVL